MGGEDIMPRPFQPPNISTPEALITYANETTDKLLGVGFLAIFTIVVFAICKSKLFMRNSDSLAVATFLNTVVGFFFWLNGWVLIDKVIIFSFLTILSILWSFLDRD